MTTSVQTPATPAATSLPRAAAPAQMRVARPTARLGAVVAFYRDALGMTVLGGFADHDGFDGVMLGHPGLPWHLEFTAAAAHPAPSGPPHDDALLVFYHPRRADWQAAVDRIEALGHRPVASANPYWDRAGRTYQDPDGYRVVVQNAEWQA